MDLGGRPKEGDGERIPLIPKSAVRSLPNSRSSSPGPPIRRPPAAASPGVPRPSPSGIAAKRERERTLNRSSATDKSKDVKQADGGMDPTTKSKLLLISFIAMLIFGTGNKVFGKLETLPMQNYPLFQSLLGSFVYIPVSFAYIIPMNYLKPSLFEPSREIPQYQFAVMGVLDGVSGLMQTFATNYISNGSLIILLTQAAIPVSMLISKIFLEAKYSPTQYIGAGVVISGIILVLVPSFFRPQDSPEGPYHNELMWAAVMVISCVPMCLSSVYKEKALGEKEIDVVWLNGYVAIYQFLISLPLAIPSANASNLTIAELPQNIWDGLNCYVGINSRLSPSRTHPADHCEGSPFYVNVYLAFNLVYNVLLIMILKYGSANLLYLALTVMVPLGNLAFSLDFVPGHQPLRPTDISGLAVIMTGLVLYRFGDKVIKRIRTHTSVSFMEDEDDSRGVSRRAMMYFNVNGVEAMQGMLEPYIRLANQKLHKSPMEIRSSYLSRLGFGTSPGSVGGGTRSPGDSPGLPRGRPQKREETGNGKGPKTILPVTNARRTFQSSSPPVRSKGKSSK